MAPTRGGGGGGGSEGVDELGSLLGKVAGQGEGEIMGASLFLDEKGIDSKLVSHYLHPAILHTHF